MLSRGGRPQEGKDIVKKKKNNNSVTTNVAVESSRPGQGYVNVFSGDTWLGMLTSVEAAQAWVTKAGIADAKIVPAREQRPSSAFRHSSGEVPR